ncbi:MAG: phenylacetate-CoA oxygenase subunit PaaI, partial [Flavobacteriales bacterium]|nr:phenylacetate-CoA oxygenase subunit PaaI [Flavobacteriales bacterium]
PHDENSPRSGNALKWKIKRETNDALRQRFIDRTIPQAEFLGLQVPDPDLSLQENGSYKFGEINWVEFNNVIHGNGPCNQQRLAHHRKAHDDGKWVRDAAKAYNERLKKTQQGLVA